MEQIHACVRVGRTAHVQAKSVDGSAVHEAAHTTREPSFTLTWFELARELPCFLECEELSEELPTSEPFSALSARNAPRLYEECSDE